ncbi:hypothetical protein LTR09_003203 [Extremus antarcticus]|uniref:WLM domain-containing protein n=1 Tax=Extremus antarcticus TaxID=702011 RepID=A0AAJ0GEH5_9PEZI|nr:hypothetical protein LTR09_003203 [Extremus antarcticus]
MSNATYFQGSTGREPSPGASASNSNNEVSDSEDELEVEADNEPSFSLTVHLHNKPIELPFQDSTATLQDLSDTVADALQIPPSNQKFHITPKTGLLKPPFANPDLLLSTLTSKKITLLGATTAEVSDLTSTLESHFTRLRNRASARAAARSNKPTKARDWKKVQDEARYTFHTITPLPHLPSPDKSQRFLERLRDDAGIKSSMRKHGFAVGLLTEMDPAEHTTHESRTLGLNRNRGEVIELRLRTDAYDGYRDYKVIRKTLCHELAHNVWGEHDSRFWKLCREIEGEVERNDWRRGGKSVGGEEFYNPQDEGEDEEADGGGWMGGEYVLGGNTDATGSMDRREIMAKAAEERIKRQHEAKAREDKAKGDAAK